MERFSNEAYYLFFSALASRIRLAIVDVLIEGPKSLADVSRALDQEEKVTSENLERLVHCAVVCVEGSGKERKYALNLEIVEPLSEILEFHVSKYCPGQKECITTKKLREYMKKEAAKETFIEHE
jgi:DNA-binding transcriptional ArsR family regulator